MKQTITTATREKLRLAAFRQHRVNGQFAKPANSTGVEKDAAAGDASETPKIPAETPKITAGKPTARRNSKLNRKTLVARVSTSIERELSAVEQLLADSGEASALDAETERRARTLASLARTLRELSQLEQAKTKPKADDNDAIPRDLDELRRELARRLDALIADAKATYPDPSGVTVDGAAD